ncbi:MAG TPA: hypothetical protein VL463_22815 [Kofleriaceae bacterium]|nr:hypothetical protein [Kofleriaceae bacterium]
MATALAGCGGGASPELDAVPDQVAQVGQELRIELVATDPSGAHLDYDFHADIPDLAGHASMTRSPNGAGVFRWTPLAADVGVWYVDFTASNGSQSATTTARIEVKAATGKASAPAFVQPLGSGTTLDLAQKSCLDLNVVVQDQDSTDVTIAEEQPMIDGATIDMTGGLSATWHWCPTDEQIAAADRYTLELSADDGSNPKTILDYLIVLRRKPQTGCTGAAPVITHTPADAQTAAPLTISANISDDKGLAAAPLFYYSTTPPASPPDLGAMTQLTMHLTSGDMLAGTWAADVPNPVANTPQGSATVYYVIVAEDADDPNGTCDHTTQSTTYMMNVMNPGPVGCVDDIYEDDDHASIANPTIQPDDWYDGMQICKDDDDWYKLRLHDGDHLIVDLTFTQNNDDQDLDLHLYKGATTDLTPCTEQDPTTCALDNGQSAHSNEHLEWDVAAGSGCASGCNYYVIVHGFGGSENSYSIAFQVQ